MSERNEQPKREKILRRIPRKFKVRDVLTTDEACALAGVPERTLQRHAMRGLVRAIKIKPKTRATCAWMFPKINLEAYLRARDIRRADLDQRRRVKKSADA
jgi:hypothetical protein